MRKSEADFLCFLESVVGRMWLLPPACPAMLGGCAQRAFCWASGRRLCGRGTAFCGERAAGVCGVGGVAARHGHGARSVQAPWECPVRGVLNKCVK